MFDGTKDLCGLQLQGIEKQASVGFLSYLECLRYLEVVIWHRPSIFNFKTSGGQPFEMPLLASLGARKWNAPNSPVFPAGDFSWYLNILIACNYTNDLEKIPFACSSALLSRSSVTPRGCSICFHSSGHGPERLHPWHKVSGGEISLSMSVWSCLVIQYIGPKSERVRFNKQVFLLGILFSIFASLDISPWLFNLL